MKKQFKITTLSSLMFAPLFAIAATTIANPLGGGNSIAGLIELLLGGVVRVGGVVAIFAFIWAGFLFVRAQGNPTELAKAKEIFLNTCIGVAVLLGAQLLASIIVNTLNTLR